MIICRMHFWAQSHVNAEKQNAKPASFADSCDKKAVMCAPAWRLINVMLRNLLIYTSRHWESQAITHMFSRRPCDALTPLVDNTVVEAGHSPIPSRTS